jgi:hypothetical protein
MFFLPSHQSKPARLLNKRSQSVLGRFVVAWFGVVVSIGATWAQNVTYTPVHDNTSFNALSVNVNLAVGSTPGAGQVSPSGGSTYSIPIALPPGTNGIVPLVALTYNSQAGNGLAGMGWNIAGLSAISRAPQSRYYDQETNAVEFTNKDNFMLDGSRLLLITGSNGNDGATYGTESENFATVTAKGDVSSLGSGVGPDWFEMITKDGVIMEFGHTTDSRYTSNQSNTRLT